MSQLSFATSAFVGNALPVGLKSSWIESTHVSLYPHKCFVHSGAETKPCTLIVPTSEMSDREWRKEQQMEIMRKKLQKRREGKALEGVVERRAAVEAQINSKEKPKSEEEDPLEAWKRQREKEGIKPVDGTYYDEEDQKGGIPIPMASFGIPKYDNGERFDLKLPYVDKGYVDKNYEGPLDKLKGLFGFGKGKK